VRLATWNVNSLGARLERVESWLAEVEPDVLCLQETKLADDAFPSLTFSALGYDSVHHGQGRWNGVAILSRFALRDPHVIELPRYQVVFNSARRVAVAATIQLDGRPVRLYSVHLDNRINPADRSAQLAPVLADAREAPGVPAIIAGDMNTSPVCWIGHVVPIPCGVQDNRLEAAVRSHGFQTPVRASGATSKWLAMRLDAIYTRHLDVADFGVDDVVRVSDHLPLWADVHVPPRVATTPAASRSR